MRLPRLAALPLAALLAALPAGAGQRRALVIGNSTYAEGRLGNPLHDAADVAARLKPLGFEVTLRTDLSLAALQEAVARFGESLQAGDESFAFYAGHAIQVKGENFLVPIDFKASSETDAQFRAYPLEQLLGNIEERRPAVSIVVLDACRDNPFKAVQRRGGARGLRPVVAQGVGTLIAFATAPGKTAADGDGRNGVFTAALLKHLADRVNVRDMFDSVSEDVAAATSNEQVPFVNAPGPMRKYWLAGKASEPTPVARAAAPMPPTVPAPAPEVPRAPAATAKAQPAQPKAPEPPPRPAEVVAAASPPPAPKGAPEPAPQAGARIEPKSGLEMVPLPAGRFHLGCEPQDKRCSQNEKPGREVEVAAFSMGKTAVTASAFARCAAARACNAEVKQRDTDGHLCNWKNGRLDHPMNCVNWKEARAFCAWAGGRLPSAEEWEYAAKSGGSRVYPWGDEPVDGRRANYCDKNCPKAIPSDDSYWRQHGWIDDSQDDGFAATSPVGSHPAGATRWGLLDMAGNIWQWTATDFDDSGAKEFRGGGWHSGRQFLRASCRSRNWHGAWRDFVGFRCAW